MRELVFGSMPEGATPESHIAAGAWCFSGREEVFPGWDGTPHPRGRAFPLPLDPYPDGPAIAEAARAANGEVLRLTRLHGPGLLGCAEGEAPSNRYLDMALGPFMLLAVHMLAERQKRVQDLTVIYGDERLRLTLLPEDLPFSFRDCADFKRNGIHDAAFNHYVYSRIVEALAPATWQLAYTDAPPALHRAESAPGPGLKTGVRLFLRKRLRDLPFPRYKGFRLWQSLVLSLAALGNKRTQPDASIDFADYCGPPLTWFFPAEKLIEACLPLALKNSTPPTPAAAPPSSPGPLRGMTAAYMEDDAYRLRLAAMRERGCRLFSVQHGANYGNLLSLGSIPFEYSQHAFYTWGWQGQEGFAANAGPMPHPGLCSIADTHRETSPTLILVGAEMSAYSYRLKSRPQAGALPEYRHSKLRFLRHMRDFFQAASPEAAPPKTVPPKTVPPKTVPPEALPSEAAIPETAANGPKTSARLMYRPYFSIPGGLDDGAYVLRHMPEMEICDGDLTARMLSCRLLVLDHYGTTLHMALAADVPCIAFWDPKDWRMDKASEELVDKLRSAGLVHASALGAAQKAAEIWHVARAWWHGPAVQEARRCWLDSFANTGTMQGGKSLAGDVRLARLWFRAIREA